MLGKEQSDPKARKKEESNTGSKRDVQNRAL